MPSVSGDTRSVLSQLNSTTVIRVLALITTVLLLTSQISPFVGLAAAASGSITVDVSDESGSTVSNAEVILYDSNWNHLETVYTASDGEATFSGYTSGDYRYEVYKDGEFWGGGSLSLGSGESLTEYFTRSEPYETQTDLTDKTNGDGTYYVGETVNIAPNVRNDVSYGRNVRVKILVDTNNDGVADITELRGPLTIDGDSSAWYGYDYVPQTAGTKQVRVKVQTDFGGDWVLTDDTGWARSFSVNANTGSVDLTVSDQSGADEEDATVVLYDGNWNQIDTKATNYNGRVSWSGLDPGTYHYETYVENEFWGGGTFDIDKGQTTTESFRRVEPYQTGTSVTDAGDGDGTHIVGEQVRLQADVTNGGTAARDVKVTYEIDVDNDGDSDQTRTTASTQVDGGSTVTFSETFTTQTTGTKSVRLAVKSYISGGWSTTDKTGWVESFNVHSDTGTLTVTPRDENGNTQSGVTVTLYNDNWAKLGSKETDSSGDVTWSGLDEGTYHVEAYGDDGFWGGTTASVTAATTTTQTIQRVEPYETQTTLTDREGNGKHIVGETVTISPRVFNDVAYARDVRVKILVDTNNDGVAEITETRGPVTISGDSRTWFGYEHIIESAGTKQVRTIVETKFTTDGTTKWAQTDDTGWHRQFETHADAGSLTVTATDTAGNPTSGATVVLYDDTWSEVGEKTTDSSGTASWSSLATGTYHIEIYDADGSFWGGATADIAAAETTTKTVHRIEPYESATTLNDTEGNGKHVVGETVLISPKVFNDVSYARDVRVKILVDTNNDGTADVTTLRGPLTISGDSSKWYGYEHAIESAGTKQVRTIVETKFTTDGSPEWVQTDDTGWHRQFTAIKDSGTLQVTAKQSTGTLATGATVVLYNETWSQLDKQETGSDGTASWSTLASGSYHVEVYGANDSFWGGSTVDVAAGDTTTKALHRSEPYETATQLQDASNGDGVYQVDETVVIKPTVYNNETVTKTVRTKIALDTDNDGTADVTATRGPKTISANSTANFEYAHVLSKTGTKQARVIVETKFTVNESTKWAQTDDTGWHRQFEAQSSVTGIAVTVTNRTNDSVAGATVVLYNDSWSEIDKRQTSPDGSVSWVELDPGTYHLEAYGQNGSFWGGSTVDVQAGLTSVVTLQRSEPYVTAVDARDTTDGDGIFLRGESLTLNATVMNHAAGKDVRVTFQIDTDGDGTVDETVIGGPQTVYRDDPTGITTTYTPSSTGTHRVRALIETKFTVNGSTEWIQTDRTGWWASVDVVSEQIDLQVTALRADGSQASDVTVAVYDENYEFLTQKEVSDGTATFTNLTDGQRHVEVYGPAGFWNATAVTIGTGPTSTTIRRAEPRAQQTVFEDGNQDGTYVVNETVTATTTVVNNKSYERRSRVIVQLDTDGDGEPDTNRVTSNASSIVSGGTQTYTTSFVPTTTGSRSARVLVQTYINNNWSTTDASTWRLIDVKSDSGSLTITPTGSSESGDPVSVVLYNQSYVRIGEQTVDVGETATWTDLESGEYHVEVYGPDGFWAVEAVSVEAHQQVTETVARNEPHVTKIERTPSSVNAEDTVTTEISITNDKSYARSVQLQYELDLDGDGTADQVTYSSTKTVAGGSTATVTVEHQAPSSGTVQERAVVKAEIAGEMTTTDDTGWVTAYTVGAATTTTTSSGGSGGGGGLPGGGGGGQLPAPTTTTTTTPAVTTTTSVNQTTVTTTSSPNQTSTPTSTTTTTNGTTATTTTATTSPQKKHGTLVVTAVSDSGDALSDATVIVRGYGQSKSKTTGENGEVTFESLRGGNYIVKVETGGASTMRQVPVTPGTTTTLRTSLTTASVKFSGSVYAHLSQSGIADATVKVAGRTTTTGSDGTFSFEEPFAPNQYTVRVYKNDHLIYKGEAELKGESVSKQLTLPFTRDQLKDGITDYTKAYLDRKHDQVAGIVFGEFGVENPNSPLLIGVDTKSIDYFASWLVSSITPVLDAPMDIRDCAVWTNNDAMSSVDCAGAAVSLGGSLTFWSGAGLAADILEDVSDVVTISLKFVSHAPQKIEEVAKALWRLVPTQIMDGVLNKLGGMGGDTAKKLEDSVPSAGTLSKQDLKRAGFNDDQATVIQKLGPTKQQYVLDLVNKHGFTHDQAAKIVRSDASIKGATAVGKAGFSGKQALKLIDEGRSLTEAAKLIDNGQEVETVMKMASDHKVVSSFARLNKGLVALRALPKSNIKEIQKGSDAADEFAEGLMSKKLHQKMPNAKYASTIDEVDDSGTFILTGLKIGDPEFDTVLIKNGKVKRIYETKNQEAVSFDNVETVSGYRERKVRHWRKIADSDSGWSKYFDSSPSMSDIKVVGPKGSKSADHVKGQLDQTLDMSKDQIHGLWGTMKRATKKYDLNLKRGS